MEADILQPYYNIFPYFLLAFTSTLLLTPLIGYIAKKLGIMDLPANQRKRTDKTLDQRIHKQAKPRMGGAAVFIPFFIISLSQIEMTTQLWGLYLGLGLITIVGALDDKFELSGALQFLFQSLAAAIVVMSGITIAGIDLAGLSISFVQSSSEINILGYIYNFVFPADIITFMWIMTIVNAVNWVGGIDALGEVMAFIGAITIMLLSVKVGVIAIAVIPAIFAGAMLGYIPYNFPPSKIIGGTVGHTGSGFLLAVLSIINGAKISSAIILLSIPLLDMAWVLFNRMREHKTINLFKLLSVSGRVHLHHRIMDLGYSVKQTLYIEASFMALVSLVAFYFGGFSTGLLAFIGVIAGLVILFTFISIRKRRQTAIVPRKDRTPVPSDPPEDPPSVVDTGPTPEERYAY